jgi:superfamily II RNA helicase
VWSSGFADHQNEHTFVVMVEPAAPIAALPTGNEVPAPALRHLPPAGTTDINVLLDAFMAMVNDQGLSLYPAQEEAILQLLDGKHVILATPTGSGKSLVASAMHFFAMSAGQRSVYTAPIKALVSEKFFSLCDQFGPGYVGMMTGDASINRDAPILCCTAEVLCNIGMGVGRADEQPIRHVIMDEFHYYGDKERGMAWQLPLLTMADTQFLLMSGTLGDMSSISGPLQTFSKREVAEVRSLDRPVPLDFRFVETPIHETIGELVNVDRAPVYVVHFTQREAAEQAQALTSAGLIDKSIRDQIGTALHGFRFDTPFGKDIQRFLKAGIGLHHAGLLPKYRLLVEQLAQQGLLKIICGTDTLGVGVNMPVRTVLFTKLAKYDGETTGILSVRDFQQIAGRAGRRGFDNQGYVLAQAPEHVVENKRAEAKYAAGDSKKKPVKKQPEQGAVGWDATTFQRLIEKPPEALRSQFHIDHGLLLQLLQRDDGEGYRHLVGIIGRSHEAPEKRKKHLQRSRLLFQALLEAGLVLMKTIDGKKRPRVAESLQLEFSLHQALSLYLVDTLFLLDPSADDYALNVVTLVESILEHPKAILQRQEDKEKTRAIQLMKQDGVPYEERMAKLEDITYPKPNAEFVYETFNAFAKKHPWVGENIRPKSIARDMLEQYLSFNEYVQEYGLERSEGLLLRSLSDFYKTLLQSVPEARKDERVLDIEAYFRAAIARVDSSLVSEWESLFGTPSADRDNAAPLMPQVVAIDANEKTFFARIRADLHQLVLALSRQQYDRAVTNFQPTDGFGADDLKAMMTPFLAEKGDAPQFGSEARRHHHTLIDRTGPHQYRVRQVLLDPVRRSADNHDDDDQEPANDWYIEGSVDVTPDAKAPIAVDAPLLRVHHIGR